jgi:hypothetical protein
MTPYVRRRDFCGHELPHTKGISVSPQALSVLSDSRVRHSPTRPAVIRPCHPPGNGGLGPQGCRPAGSFSPDLNAARGIALAVAVGTAFWISLAVVIA